MESITISNGLVNAEINPNNGQLVSITLGGYEYMHPGGKAGYDGPDWKNSEIVPFPIFGPADNQRVRVDGKTYYLEQHGISRYLLFLCRQAGSEAALVQKHAGNAVINPKYSPGSSHPPIMNWSAYTLEKKFTITENGVECEIAVRNDAAHDMPYMIGWHPAFNTLGNPDAGVFTLEGKSISLEEVVAASAVPPEEAYSLPGIRRVMYRNGETGRGIFVSSNDFENIMLWSPGKDSGMLSIEHASQLPVYENQRYFEDMDKFEVLAPGASRSYAIYVELL